MTELIGDIGSQWAQSRLLAECPDRLGSDCQVSGSVAQLTEFQKSLPGLCDSTSECELCKFLHRRLSALNIEPQQPLTFARVESAIRVYPFDLPIASMYFDSGM